jgi:TetR/AcrR family transcriptional repressor of lmrAB and yxaGH operons
MLCCIVEVMPHNEVRTKMVEGALRLLAINGVEGTSFSGVLAATGAPRGSVYHHFPGGKTELLHAALDLASERTRGQPPAVVVARFLDLWRALLTRSNLTAGCAVLAVTVATGDDELLDHAGTIFRTWADLLAELFTTSGMKKPRARELAVTVIAATEGAVALSRAQRSRAPFDHVAATLTHLAREFRP